MFHVTVVILTDKYTDAPGGDVHAVTHPSRPRLFVGFHDQLHCDVASSHDHSFVGDGQAQLQDLDGASERISYTYLHLQLRTSAK